MLLFFKKRILRYCITQKSRKRIRVFIGHNKLKARGANNLMGIYKKFSNYNFILFNKNTEDYLESRDKNYYLKLKLLKRMQRRSINRNIFYYSSFGANAKLATFPLPKEYIKIIDQTVGLNISYFGSGLRFKWLVIKEGLKAVDLFLRLLKYSFTEKNNCRANSIYFYDVMPSIFEDNDYSLLNQLTAESLPSIDKIYMSKTFALSLHNNDSQLTSKVQGTNFPFGSFDRDIKSILRFSGNFVQKLLHALVRLFIFGDWHYLYLLPDTLKASYVALLDSDKIAMEHFQSQSDILSRELWTENAKLTDKSFAVFFYATSIIPQFFKDQPLNVSGYFWHLMNWDKAYLTKEFCIDYLKNENTQIKDFQLIKPFTWFTEEKLYAPDHLALKNAITFFDLAPHTFYIALSQGEINWKYSFRNGMRAIDMIESIAADLHLPLIVKLKRRTRFLNKRYSRKLDLLTGAKILVDVNPRYLVNHSMCIINSCFTSTAHLAQRKNSVYLDPSDSLLDPYNITEDIRLITTEKHLRKWVSSIYQSPKDF